MVKKTRDPIPTKLVISNRWNARWHGSRGTRPGNLYSLFHAHFQTVWERPAGEEIPHIVVYGDSNDPDQIYISVLTLNQRFSIDNIDESRRYLVRQAGQWKMADRDQLIGELPTLLLLCVKYCQRGIEMRTAPDLRYPGWSIEIHDPIFPGAFGLGVYVAHGKPAKRERKPYVWLMGLLNAPMLQSFVVESTK